MRMQPDAKTPRLACRPLRFNLCVPPFHRGLDGLVGGPMRVVGDFCPGVFQSTTVTAVWFLAETSFTSVWPIPRLVLPYGHVLADGSDPPPFQQTFVFFAFVFFEVSLGNFTGGTTHGVRRTGMHRLFRQVSHFACRGRPVPGIRRAQV